MAAGTWGKESGGQRGVWRSEAFARNADKQI
jgi:hypothetical protein